MNGKREYSFVNVLVEKVIQGERNGLTIAEANQLQRINTLNITQTKCQVSTQVKKNFQGYYVNKNHSNFFILINYFHEALFFFINDRE